MNFYVFYGLTKSQDTIDYLGKLGEALEKNHENDNSFECDSPHDYVRKVMNEMCEELPCSEQTILRHVAYLDHEGKRQYLVFSHVLDENDRKQKQMLGQAVARRLRKGNSVNPRYYEYMNWC